VDEQSQGRGMQYLVCWQGEGPEGDEWLPASKLENCEVLDHWQAWKTEDKTTQGLRQQTAKLTIMIPPLCPS